MVARSSELTAEHREFIVRKLAAFWPARYIYQQLVTQFNIKCTEDDVLANDPTKVVMAPEYFMLFRAEREKVLNDPTSDPYTDQKARLILLSLMVDIYKNNNQIAESRSVMQQIMAELGVGAGGKSSGKSGVMPAAAETIDEIRVTIVDPKKQAT